MESLLKDIENLMLAIELSCSEMGGKELQMLSSFQRIENAINESGNALSSVNMSVKELNVTFLPLYFDSDLQVSKKYIEKVFNTNVAINLEINYGNYKLLMQRLTNFNCTFIENTLHVESKWKLVNSINEQSTEYILKLYLKFYSKNSIINVYLVRSPSFLDLNLNEVNPFKSLPIVERFEILEETHNTFKEFIGKLNFEIPPYQIDDQEVPFAAKEFLLDNSLMIYSRGLTRNRTRYILDLKRNSNNYDFVAGIRKEHINAIISKIVQARDASLINIKFLHGKIEIESYGSKSESFWHISVKGKVWMGHNIYLSIDYGSLKYTASWSFWRYKIKAELCWPICGKVINEAEKEITKAINSRKTFNGQITSSFGSNARCRVVPDGLTFYFNK